MPNHVTNVLTIHVDDEERLLEILDAIKLDNVGLGSIDFNKIIPMPDTVFCGDLGPDERREYGRNNWYDWSVANWGTKWNSYGYAEPHTHDGGNRIEFQTAWTRPEQVIQKLSELYPDAQFQHAWADENIGYNVGEITYTNGETLEWDTPIGGSKEAYEMASGILDYELAEAGLFYNDKTGNYVYRENEEESEDQGMGGMS